MDLNLTLLGQAITFSIFVWFTMTYVWPPLTQAIADRQKKIADGLAAAKDGEEALARANSDIAAQMQEAKHKAAEIIEQAQKRADAIVEEAKGRAKEEGERLVAGARSEIEQQTQQAKEQLRNQVATIALMGAEKVLNKSIGADEHTELLNELAANM